jgi:hypothetical protein
MRVDTGLNILTLISCLFVIGYVAGVKFGAPSQRRADLTGPGYEVGETIGDSTALGLETASATIIVVTASTCRFCTASMSFYQRLCQAAKEAQIRVVAVATEPVETNRGYLMSHGVTPDAVVAASEAKLKSRATPTVLLASGARVVGSWRGQLSTAREMEILEAIKRLRHRG